MSLCHLFFWLVTSLAFPETVYCPAGLIDGDGAMADSDRGSGGSHEPPQGNMVSN